MSSGGGKGGSDEDRLISELGQDPGSHETATVLVGFLGRSAVAGHRRLYLSEELDTWVDIPEEAILRVRPLQAAAPTAEEGSKVWIRSGTQLRYATVDSRTVQADMLKGRVLQDFRGAVAPPPIDFGETEAVRPTIYGCTRYACPSDFGGECPTTRVPQCPYGSWGCPKTRTYPCPQPPASWNNCPTQFGCTRTGLDCPIVSVGCPPHSDPPTPVTPCRTVDYGLCASRVC